MISPVSLSLLREAGELCADQAVAVDLRRRRPSSRAVVVDRVVEVDQRPVRWMTCIAAPRSSVMRALSVSDAAGARSSIVVELRRSSSRCRSASPCVVHEADRCCRRGSMRPDQPTANVVERCRRPPRFERRRELASASSDDVEADRASPSPGSPGRGAPRPGRCRASGARSTASATPGLRERRLRGLRRSRAGCTSSPFVAAYHGLTGAIGKQSGCVHAVEHDLVDHLAVERELERRAQVGGLRDRRADVRVRLHEPVLVPDVDRDALVADRDGLARARAPWSSGSPARRSTGCAPRPRRRPSAGSAARAAGSVMILNTIESRCTFALL